MLFLVTFNKTPTPLLLFTKRVTTYFFQQSDQFIFRSDGLKKIVYKNGALWVAAPVRHNNLTSWSGLVIAQLFLSDNNISSS